MDITFWMWMHHELDTLGVDIDRYEMWQEADVASNTTHNDLTLSQRVLQEEDFYLENHFPDVMKVDRQK